MPIRVLQRSRASPVGGLHDWTRARSNGARVAQEEYSKENAQDFGVEGGKAEAESECSCVGRAFARASGWHLDAPPWHEVLVHPRYPLRRGDLIFPQNERIAQRRQRQEALRALLVNASFCSSTAQDGQALGTGQRARSPRQGIRRRGGILCSEHNIATDQSVGAGLEASPRQCVSRRVQHRPIRVEAATGPCGAAAECEGRPRCAHAT